MQGWMLIYRRDKDGKTEWARRFFRIKDTRLVYGETEGQMQRHATLVDASVHVSRSQGSRFQFRVRSPDVKHAGIYLRAPDLNALVAWLDAIRSVRGVTVSGVVPTASDMASDAPMKRPSSPVVKQRRESLASVSAVSLNGVANSSRRSAGVLPEQAARPVPQPPGTFTKPSAPSATPSVSSSKSLEVPGVHHAPAPSSAGSRSGNSSKHSKVVSSSTKEKRSGSKHSRSSKHSKGSKHGRSSSKSSQGSKHGRSSSKNSRNSRNSKHGRGKMSRSRSRQRGAPVAEAAVTPAPGPVAVRRASAASSVTSRASLASLKHEDSERCLPGEWLAEATLLPDHVISRLTDLSSLLDVRIAVLIVAALPVEYDAVRRFLRPLDPARPWVCRVASDSADYHVGRIAGLPVVAVLGGDVAGSPPKQVVAQACRTWRPAIVASAGLAYGLFPKHQRIGDVLIANTLLSPQSWRPTNVGGGASDVIKRGSATLRTLTSKVVPQHLPPSTDAKDQHVRALAGLVATGAADGVVHDAPRVLTMKQKHTKTLGGEIARSGVVGALDERVSDLLVVKTVVCFANAEDLAMNTHTHWWACVVSMAALQHILQHGFAPHAPSPASALAPANLLPPHKPFAGRNHPVLASMAECTDKNGQCVLRPADSSVSGTGLSSMALEFAWRACARYDTVFWLQADSAAVLDHWMREAAERVGVSTRGFDSHEVGSMLSERLTGLTSSWCLVVDSARKSETLLQPLLQPPPGHQRARHHVVMASRETGWPHEVVLPVLQRQDAIDVLQRGSGTGAAARAVDMRAHREPDAAVLALLDRLDRLPLPLSIAASVMSATKQSPAWLLHEMDVLCQEKGSDIDAVAALALIALRSAVPVAATLSVAHLCSFLAPHSIPILGVLDSVRDWRLGIAGLRRVGLLHDDGPNTVGMHRRVQTAIRSFNFQDSDARNDELGRAAVAICDALCSRFHVRDASTWPLARRLMPHAMRVVQLAWPERVELPAIEAVITASALYFEQVLGHDDMSIAMRRARVLIASEVYGAKSPELLDATLAFANLLLAIRNPEAVDTFETAAELAQQVKADKRSTEYAKSLLGLADALIQRQRDHASAMDEPIAAHVRGADFIPDEDVRARVLALYKEAVTLLQDLLGNASADLGYYLTRYGRILFHAGDMAAARDALAHALDVYSAVFGSHSVPYANLLVQYARVEHALGDTDAAFRDMERSAAMLEHRAPAQSRVLILHANTLAHSPGASQDDRAQAAKLLRHALSQLKDGPDADVAAVKAALASVEQAK